MARVLGGDDRLTGLGGAPRFGGEGAGLEERALEALGRRGRVGRVSHPARQLGARSPARGQLVRCEGERELERRRVAVVGHPRERALEDVEEPGRQAVLDRAEAIDARVADGE